MTPPPTMIWSAWNSLGDCASPVKTIAARLGVAPAEVAAVVYPEREFGPWHDDQEPPLA